ncbi:MAG TPA: TatD family hydrolase, partial [Gammaproteobacteria bacterium]|nr:TatD family hydrolase [Gammaproteobacteria bacterium]
MWHHGRTFNQDEHLSYVDLIDVGVNLTHDSFDTDRDAVIAAARAAGVQRMIVTGTSVAASRAAAQLAQGHTGTLFATAGIHPHHAVECDAAALDTLRELTATDCVVAIGECGLDYFRNFSPARAQREAFAAQLKLAVELHMPVFLHQRDAHEDFLAIVREFQTELTGAVAHCFTGNPAQRDAYLELGMCIGVTGWICDERRG